MTNLERRFDLLWKATVKEREDVDAAMMVLTNEHQFARHLKRKFRFDFCHEPSRTAIELQGGVWTHGAHVRPKQYKSDCEKALLARELMWATVALTTDMVASEYVNRIIDLCLSRQFISGGHTDYVVHHPSPNAFPNPSVRVGEPSLLSRQVGQSKSRK